MAASLDSKRSPAGILHYFLNNVIKKKVALHPEEVSLLKGKAEAEQILSAHGFKLIDYSFSIRDFFIAAVVVGEKCND